MLRNRSSRFTTSFIFSFFFNLVEKKLLMVETFLKCRENGIDRLRNEAQ